MNKIVLISKSSQSSKGERQLHLVNKDYSRVSAQGSGSSDQEHLTPRDITESDLVEAVSKLISDGREGIDLKEKKESPLRWREQGRSTVIPVQQAV